MKNFKKPTDKELQELLDEVQYSVTQQNATERPFSSPHNNNFKDGIYVDIVTGEALFSSRDKFNAGCGWPSFAKPISKNVVNELSDNTYGMNRVEVRSALANSHLGHVFYDGPQELGGARYCINGAALKFVPKDNLEKEGYGEYLSIFEKTSY